jgi:hypothetical protein
MHQVRPAIVMRDRKVPRAALFVLTALAALWAVGSLVALLVELRAGATGTFAFTGQGVPFWASLPFVDAPIVLPVWGLWAVSTPIAGLVGWNTFAGWRMAGPNHGLVDYVLEAGGMILIRRRTWGRARELLVRRGEPVSVAAELVRSARGGKERVYRFALSAPSGTMTFLHDVHIERLSLAPLDEVASTLGIEVEVSGEATALGRLGTEA